MKHDVRQEWPMQAYLANWKVFRSLSDENEVTAEHLLTQEYWPHRSNTTIVDVGCGDGRLIFSLLHKSGEAIGTVRLIDPDAGVLKSACDLIEGISFVHEVEAYEGTAEDLLHECILGAHAVLAVHVVYLMQQESLEHIIQALAPGVPLYVVLDAPGSVFSRLWSKLAPHKYLERSEHAHTVLRALPSDRFVVNPSEITSHLENPLTCHREKKLSILSILCYCDVRDLESDKLNWAEAVLEKYRVGNRISCKSFCYEVVKRSDNSV